MKYIDYAHINTRATRKQTILAALDGFIGAALVLAFTILTIGVIALWI